MNMIKINFKWILGLIYGALIIIFITHPGYENVVFNQSFYLIAPITAVVSGLVALQYIGWNGKRSMVLEFLLVGVILWLFGEITTLIFAIKGESPYPSIVDVFFLTGYLCFSLSAILESKLFGLQLKQLSSKILVVIGSVFALIVGGVSYIAVLGYHSEENLLVNITTISWSIGDLVMGALSMVLLTMVWRYNGGTVKRPWLWFITAALVNLIADTIYNANPSAVTDGSQLNIFLNALWIAAYFLFAGYFLEACSILEKLKMKVSSQET